MLTVYLLVVLVVTAHTMPQNLRSYSSKIGVNMRKGEECKPMPSEVLRKLHGPAFNPRYMSAVAPADPGSSSPPGHHKPGGGKPSKKHSFFSFDVDETYNEILSYDPAWLVPYGGAPDPFSMDSFFEELGLGRDEYKRNARETERKEPWHCKSTVSWLDLGHDYYPRYQRHVQCYGQKCWFSSFQCKTRSFTVKLLRRIGGLCVYNNGTGVGVNELAKGMYESWVWEEHAVPYCCDCVPVL